MCTKYDFSVSRDLKATFKWVVWRIWRCYRTWYMSSILDAYEGWWLMVWEGGWFRKNVGGRLGEGCGLFGRGWCLLCLKMGCRSALWWGHTIKWSDLRGAALEIFPKKTGQPCKFLMCTQNFNRALLFWGGDPSSGPKIFLWLVEAFFCYLISAMQKTAEASSCFTSGANGWPVEA